MSSVQRPPVVRDAVQPVAVSLLAAPCEVVAHLQSLLLLGEVDHRQQLVVLREPLEVDDK